MSNSCIVASWLLGFLAYFLLPPLLLVILWWQFWCVSCLNTVSGGGGVAGLVTRAELKITGGHRSNLLFVRA